MRRLPWQLLLFAPLGCAALVGVRDIELSRPDEPSRPDDASVDASADVVTADDAGRLGPGTWCEEQRPAHGFCADFDTDPPNAGWTGTALVGPSTVSFPASDRSSPSLLQARIESVGAADLAMLSRRLDVSATEAHLAFDVLVAPFAFENGSTGGLALFDFFLTPEYELQLLRTASGELEILEIRRDDAGRATYAVHLFQRSLPSSRWVAFVLDLARTAQEGTSAQAKIDGESVLVTTILAPRTFGPLDLRLGLNSFGNAATNVARFDNVTIDWK